MEVPGQTDVFDEVESVGGIDTVTGIDLVDAHPFCVAVTV